MDTVQHLDYSEPKYYNVDDKRTSCYIRKLAFSNILFSTNEKISLVFLTYKKAGVMQKTTRTICWGVVLRKNKYDKWEIVDLKRDIP